MRTWITELFGVEFPLFAFSHCRNVVAAVTELLTTCATTLDRLTTINNS
jgi:hypothetical protein